MGNIKRLKPRSAALEHLASYVHPLFQNMWHLGPIVGPYNSENEELFEQPNSEAFAYEQVFIVKGKHCATDFVNIFMPLISISLCCNFRSFENGHLCVASIQVFFSL